MKTLLTCVLLFLAVSSAYSFGNEQQFNFQFEDETLNGVLTLPKNESVKGIVLIVHGYGATNAVEQKWYSRVRKAINNAGYGTYMWDKMGCGDSTGSFDINQPVDNSADEAIAAIKTLRSEGIPGADTIGLWGISRAGWINPLVIQKIEDIAFWISVSGVDDKENFKYLLEQNLIIEGYSYDEAKKLALEWKNGMLTAQQGGSYWEYKAVTKNLSKNDFWLRFSNGGYGFFSYQLLRYELSDSIFDQATGLQVYIEDFVPLLKSLKIPVLALFGEKDMNVDWRKTMRLYEETIDETLLTQRAFPNCNHNIFEAETGGYYEFQDNQLPYKRCKGFLETITQWLNSQPSSK